MEEEKEVESLKKIEAVLFISARFLSINELNMLTGINPISLREMLEELRNRYGQQNSAIVIFEKNDMWKMDVKPEYSHSVMRFASGKPEFSKAEQESLAVIAYKQPLKQSVLVKIRGNKAYEHVKHLIDSSLIKTKKAGHTLILELSEQFYDYFKLVKKDGKDVMESLETKEQIEEKKNKE